ncbi:CPCC family cysteine-rich protein [Streptomyces sp. JW3]
MGAYEICAVCYWEDDLVQLRLPLLGGAGPTPSV